jgi:hypothetical protein
MYSKNRSDATVQREATITEPQRYWGGLDERMTWAPDESPVRIFRCVQLDEVFRPKMRTLRDFPGLTSKP